MEVSGPLLILVDDDLVKLALYAFFQDELSALSLMQQRLRSLGNSILAVSDDVEQFEGLPNGVPSQIRGCQLG